MGETQARRLNSASKLLRCNKLVGGLPNCASERGKYAARIPDERCFAALIVINSGAAGAHINWACGGLDHNLTLQGRW
jgi:hypothetical protein